MAQIFISYRRADSQAITDRIYERLVDAFGRKAIFKDVDDIPLGMHFPSHLETVIKDSKIVLVIMGRSWANITDDAGNKRLNDPDDFVRVEVESSLNLKGAIVIPVLVNGANMPSASQLPESLHPLLNLNAMSIGNDPAFNNDMPHLIANLGKLGIKSERPTNPMLMIGVAIIVALVVIVGGFAVFNSGGDVSETPETSIAQVASDEATETEEASEVPDTDTPEPPTETDTPEPPTETFTPSITPTPTETLEIAFVVETLDAQAAIDQATNDANNTARAVATGYAVGTQALLDQTATATLWTDTPTPNVTASIEAFRTQQAEIVTQQWIDSWTDTPTNTPTPTDTPSPTNTPSNTPTDTPIPTDTPSNTPTPTDTPSNTPTPTDTPSNTPTPTDTPSNTPTPTPLRLLEHNSTNWRDTIAELEDKDLIGSGGSLIFDADNAFFDGIGSWFTALARDASHRDIVMAAELEFNTDSTEYEACGLLARVVTNSQGSAVTSLKVSIDNDGYVFWVDRENDVIEFGDVSLGLDLDEAHHLLFLALDDNLTVFVDGELVFDNIRITSRSGSFGLTLTGKGINSRCEGNNIWAYAVP